MEIIEITVENVFVWKPWQLSISTNVNERKYVFEKLMWSWINISELLNTV